MNRKKNIVILRHRPYHSMGYAIDHYAHRWIDDGHQVIYHIGPDDIPDADVVIVHINLTVVPQEYIDLINKQPVVINGKILDISRTLFSQLALSRTDNYQGPVIVKTNMDFGGYPEKAFLNDGESVRRWDTIDTLNPFKYPIFKDVMSVPHGVWKNSNLIVERFINTPENGLFYLHYCAFFGDKEIAGRIGSPNPIVKWGNSVSDEETSVPDEVRQWRKELKIDYGRFDYLEFEGKYFLLDINKTEGGGKTNYQYPAEMDFLASGLEFYIDDKSRDS